MAEPPAMWKTRSDAKEFKIIERIGDRVADKAIAFTAVTAPVVLTMAVFAVMIDRTNKQNESTETQSQEQKDTQAHETPPQREKLFILPPVEEIYQYFPEISDFDKNILHDTYEDYRKTFQFNNVESSLLLRPLKFFKAFAHVYSLHDNPDANPSETRPQKIPDQDFVNNVVNQMVILKQHLLRPLPTLPRKPDAIPEEILAFLWLGIIQQWVKDPTYSPESMPTLNPDQKREQDKLIEIINSKNPSTLEFSIIAISLPFETPVTAEAWVWSYQMANILEMAKFFHRMDAKKKQRTIPISVPVIRSDLQGRLRRPTPTPTPATNPASSANPENPSQ